jgi:hypothetical protein
MLEIVNAKAIDNELPQLEPAKPADSVWVG